MIIALAFVAATAATPAASTSTGQAIVQECWVGHSRVQMSSCVAKRAAAARSDLANVERSVRTLIAKEHKGAAMALFESASRLYQQYRASQCHLREVLASAGNGASDIRVACEAALDAQRAMQLREALQWLKSGA